MSALHPAPGAKRQESPDPMTKPKFLSSTQLPEIGGKVLRH